MAGLYLREGPQPTVPQQELSEKIVSFKPAVLALAVN